MATEIERKFTVINDLWQKSVQDTRHYRQGYFSGGGKASFRIRIDGDKANLNIKSATLGVQRSEYEYSVPLAEANELLDQLCERPIIEKTRHFVEFGGNMWEIDVFEGDNAGLIVAEIELGSADQQFALPPWAGAEVSHDPRYYNVSLVKHPYKLWLKTGS